MKKYLVIALVMVSGIVFAADTANTFEVDFSTINGSSLSVSLTKELKDKVTIKVLTADRQLVLHTESIKNQTEFKKRYDFSTLKKDTYIVSVSNGAYVFEKTLEVDEEGIHEHFGASILEAKNGFIEVRLFKDISNIKTIRITDAAGEIIYQTGRVRKRAYEFNLTTLPKGFYNLDVVATNSTVSKQVEKR